MHVLHVAQPTTAGVPSVVRLLARDQVDHGLRVSVASPQGGDLDAWVREAGAAWHRWEAGREPGATVPRETVQLRRLVHALSPDVVHLHSAKAGLAGRLAVRGQIPTLFQPHAWSFEAVRGAAARAAVVWERFAARWTDLLVCVSEDEAERGRRAGVRGRCVVNPNGVDLGRWTVPDEEQRRAARAALALPDGPLVVCVGRLARQKGQDLLLAALPLLRAQVPGVRVALVGDGPDRASLSAGADVLLPGARPDVRPWVWAADVVAVPSRWEAGVPLVALEAMASGRPVVLSDVAGASEVRGVASVVPVEDVGALADALVRSLRDPAWAADAGVHGRAHVERLHDQAGTATRARQAYAAVLDARRR